MEQIKKRKNPFAIEVDDPIFEEKPASSQESIFQPQQQEPQLSVVRQSTRQERQPKQQQQRDVDASLLREKYTSTMNKALRRQIKIVCVHRGLMFAEFIEEACREKLQRDGVI